MLEGGVKAERSKALLCDRKKRKTKRSQVRNPAWATFKNMHLGARHSVVRLRAL